MLGTQIRQRIGQLHLAVVGPCQGVCAPPHGTQMWARLLRALSITLKRGSLLISVICVMNIFGPELSSTQGGIAEADAFNVTWTRSSISRESSTVSSISQTYNAEYILMEFEAPRPWCLQSES